MSGDGNRRIGTEYGSDGAAAGRARLTPTQDARRCDVVVPPDTVVPIILVPGIMGSNLRNTETGEAVWRANSVLSLAWQWLFRGAATRQRKLDPDLTEVDDDGAFFGEATTVKDKETAKQRGWGTVAKYGYGDFIPWLDNTVNVDEASPWEAMQDDADLVTAWGAERPAAAIVQTESQTAWDAFCPVHCVGYNWLKSNGESGKYLADKISEIIQYWSDPEQHGGRKWKCGEVILVTHSMGGLVSRAAVHAEFGKKQQPQVSDQVLGMVLGVMPAIGAAAAYHHVRTGYGLPSGLVLGRNAAQITAVFANASGPLELLPNQNYPSGWLQARDRADNVLLQMPQQGDDPYMTIYQERRLWWRLVDEALVDPANNLKKSKVPTTAFAKYLSRLEVASEFHYTLQHDYHDPTYTHFGADPEQMTYEKLIWQTTDPVSLRGEALRNVAVHDDDSDPVTLETAGRPEFEIADPTDPGDDTVPAASGAAPGASGGAAVKQSFRLMSGVAHGDSYNTEDNPALRQSTLYAIGKILGELKC